MAAIALAENADPIIQNYNIIWGKFLFEMCECLVKVAAMNKYLV